MSNTDRHGVAISVGDWCEVRGLDSEGKDALMVVAKALRLLDNNECMFFCGYHPLNIPGHNIIRLDDMEQFKRALEGTYSFFDTRPIVTLILGDRK